jgi:hypothetical protein
VKALHTFEAVKQELEHGAFARTVSPSEGVQAFIHSLYKGFQIFDFVPI